MASFKSNPFPELGRVLQDGWKRLVLGSRSRHDTGEKSSSCDCEQPTLTRITYTVPAFPLPQELIKCICDYLHSDTRALVACAHLIGGDRPQHIIYFHTSGYLGTSVLNDS